MTQFMTEKTEVLNQIKDTLYDRDWISSREVERVKESTELSRVFALDFSGQGLLDTIESLEHLYGISLDDGEIKKMKKVGDLVDAVMELLEIND